MNRVLATDLQHVAGVPLPAITDEVMHERLRAARRRTVVLLHATGQLVRPDADPIHLGTWPTRLRPARARRAPHRAAGHRRQ
jgi:hypothetical protein